MKKILSLLLVLFINVFYAQVPERPSPPHLYNNLSKEFPQFLTDEQAIIMENKLEEFSNQTSNQICIVIVDDLGGQDAAQFSFDLGNQWQVGKKKFNNGIVVLIKPTGSAGGRDLAIAVGYGLEGAIPDLATKRIREEMYPYLKSGDNFTALDEGTNKLMGLAKGEINVKDFTRQHGGGGRKTSTTLIILVVLLIILFRSIFRGGGGGRTFSRAGSAIFWGSMLGGSGRGSGSSWGGGGSSGGGWGGFGGGSFGGGGSSGKW